MSLHMMNAGILPLFVTWFLPNAIRDSQTGEYLGFKNRTAVTRVILLVLFESFLLITGLGFNPLTMVRITATVATTVFLAYVYVVLTKKHFDRW